MEIFEGVDCCCQCFDIRHVYICVCANMLVFRIFLDQMFKYASVNHPVIYGDTICI